MQTILIPAGRFYEIEDATTPKQIRDWWARRRVAFNIWVGLIGIMTWLSVEIAGNQAVKPGVDFEEPFAMILGPPVYAIMANICYSAGPLLDSTFYKGAPRPGLLRLGFWFSIFLTALPGLWALFCWYRVVKTGVLLD